MFHQRWIVVAVLVLLLGQTLSARAAPQQQPGEQVFGVTGTLQADADASAGADPRLETFGGATYRVVGSTPALDRRMQRLLTRTPSPVLKVWGTVEEATAQSPQPRLVVTGLLVLDEVTAAQENPLAIGDFEAINVRSRPDPTAPIIGQIGLGEAYDIMGRDARNLWWLICCIAGDSGWVQQALVLEEGDTADLPLVGGQAVAPTSTLTTTLPSLAPTPVPTAVLTATVETIAPTPTPLIITPAPPAASPNITSPNNVPTVAPLDITTPTPIAPPPTTLDPTPVAPTPLAPADASVANWQAAYFPNTDLTGDPVAVEAVQSIDFDWGDGVPAPELPPDGFSARFEQTVDLPDGFYSLRAQADDGVRVFVNDELVIDEWHLGTTEEFVVGRQLAGPTTFRVEYYEAGGQASLRFERTGAMEFPEWRVTFYNNINLEGESVWIRAEPYADYPAISHQWSLDSPVPGVVPEDNWSARWTGSFFFQDGDYLFWVDANDGARLYLDGQLVVDGWDETVEERTTVFQNVGAGQHEVTVEYFERGGIANLAAAWELEE